MPQFSTPCKPSQNSRKCVAGKIRMRWSNHNNQFNQIKIKRNNTLGTKLMDMNKIDMIQPDPKIMCKCFGPTCSYCKHDAPHPSPVHSDWSNGDRDSDKAKAKEQKSLIDFKPPKLDSDKELTDQLKDMRKVILVDDIPFQNLTIGQDKPKEEPLETINTLVPPPVAMTMALVTDMAKADDIVEDMAIPDDTTEDNNGELNEHEKRQQKEVDKYELYNKVYIGQLSEEDMTDTGRNESAYLYFG